MNQEAKAQECEENMTIAEILLKIETLLEQLGEDFRKKYSRFRSKRKKAELLIILQE
ncbi:3791_t:CDS:1, partial [Scutellospora calospora]